MLNIVEATLDEVLPRSGERPKALSDAMRYAVGSGGKRIRPIVCLASSMAVGGSADDARYPAAAIEMLHNYTLVHDDLPAMDNDIERRGKLTVWKKFGEANAILAGDALLSLAFSVALNAPRNVAAIMATLGVAGFGVVQGQVEDLERENGALPADAVDFVYAHKTADLFVAAAAMGGLAGGGSERDIEALRTFALNLGLAFQFEDDLLDGDSPFPREKTEALVRQKTDVALAALVRLPGDATLLREIANSLVGRMS